MLYSRFKIGKSYTNQLKGHYL